jgi:hypothetical protein
VRSGIEHAHNITPKSIKLGHMSHIGSRGAAQVIAKLYPRTPRYGLHTPVCSVERAAAGRRVKSCR